MYPKGRFCVCVSDALGRVLCIYDRSYGKALEVRRNWNPDAVGSFCVCTEEKRQLRLEEDRSVSEARGTFVVFRNDAALFAALYGGRRIVF